MINEVSTSGTAAISFAEFLTMMARSLKDKQQEDILRSAFDGTVQWGRGGAGVARAHRSHGEKGMSSGGGGEGGGMRCYVCASAV